MRGKVVKRSIIAAISAIFVMVLSSPGLSASVAAHDPNALAARIDQHLVELWRQTGVEPAPQADDATFLRRTYLDLVGRIPTVAEVRSYLEDSSSGKRAKLIANLIRSSAHARHMAQFWRRTWIPQVDTPRFAPLRDDVEKWITARLTSHTPYDRLVYQMLTVSTWPSTTTTKRNDVPLPIAFLVASEYKPENLAANSMRAFLGINLDCAQCHNHPFARWSRDQFWQTAAFFSRPQPAKDGDPVHLELAIPETERTVVPAFLNGDVIPWPAEIEPDTGRHLLAGWVTESGNPYFARNAVNRLWAHFFGLGLVEPLDDLSSDNPPSIPELLDELATAFDESGFDLEYLTAAIVLCRAYGLSTTPPDGSVQTEGDRLFAAMPIRGLNGEQLYDSLHVAAGMPMDRIALAAESVRQERERFIAQFQVERPALAERSVLQVLSLMNGELTRRLTQAKTSLILAAVSASPRMDTPGKVETLFLATLGRPPRESELAPLVRHLEQRTQAADSAQALADVLWVLLNSSEFSTNH
jgi:hypothetical protein